MLKIENTSVYGFMEAIRGMRNPLESHEKIDSYDSVIIGQKGCIEHIPFIGLNDTDLMERLIAAGPEHSKFMRMIIVYCDISGPLYWWKEFDTYKIGTVCNSYSTMHKIHEHEFTLDMFSHENLFSLGEPGGEVNTEVVIRDKENQNIYDVAMLSEDSTDILRITIDALNTFRHRYLRTKEKAPEEAKKYWQQMIQLLPSSYMQKRTIMSNYAVLANQYQQRKSHKLEEWRVDFMNWIDELPYANLIKRRSSRRGEFE